MFKQNFIGRGKELSWLKEQYGKKASFAVIYGRRRVGKTELAKQFSAPLPHFYFLAGEKPDSHNRRELQEKMGFFLGEQGFSDISFPSWERLFEGFMGRVKGKLIIILDEFPYLIERNPAIPSVFQRIWDEILQQREVMLILLGSSIGMMESHVLSRKSALFGRRTGQWELKPLPFEALEGFYPDAAIEDMILFYGITSGIPAYLLTTDHRKSAAWNLRNRVLKKGAYLYEEAEMLLKQEFREPANYFVILQSIAEGATRFGEICNRAELDKSMVSQYLKNLVELRIVQREFPVTQRKQSRNALYRLADYYYALWFSLVYPYKSLIEEDRESTLLRLIGDKLKKHEARVFEDVSKEFLWKVQPIPFTNIGRWWRKRQEIDLVGLDEKNRTMLFVECKWQSRVNPEKVLRELQEKVPHVRWQRKEEKYCVIAKSFTHRPQLKDCFLYDLNDMERVFSSGRE